MHIDTPAVCFVLGEERTSEAKMGAWKKLVKIYFICNHLK